MDLFNTSSNILPYDGETIYYGPILPLAKTKRYFDHLLEHLPWESDEIFIFGKRIITKRKVAWFGDEPYEYTYSKSTKTALPWTKKLLELKELVEKNSGETYNSCLLNLYHSGEEGMGWHTDDEKEMKKDGAIASMSLGAERYFVFKHKASKENIKVLLQNGSLLVMKGKTQTFWQHRLPPTKKIKTPRINLTFRTVVNQ